MRTFADADGNVLRTVTAVTRRIGSGHRAVAREVLRVESDGGRVRTRRADYWDDPATDRHGKVRLVSGDCIPWEYRDYDAEGREILRLGQRNGSPVPDVFPVPFPSDGLYDIANLYYAGLADAFVTLYGYEPLAGDAGHDADRFKPRCETRYVLQSGAATCIGRSWFRYTRPLMDGVPAVKREAWRAGAPDAAAWNDAHNAYSYETVYDETADGVPRVLRGETADALDEDGVRTAVSLASGEGTFTLTTRRAKETHAFPTYEVRILDALRGTVLRRETRLTDGDAVIDFVDSVYDGKDRLRATTYPDGTSEVYDYSCCRLLSSTDRAGRTTLRSARTGTDHLYHAFEEDIAKEIQSRGIGNEIVNADRAEDRAIAKIMNLGVPKIRPCWKSPNGWREVGIRFIAQHRCVIDARPHRAKDVWDEMSRYEHKRYKNGDLHSEYPKEGDDAADSVRYALEPDIRDWYKPKSWAPPTMRRRPSDAW